MELTAKVIAVLPEQRGAGKNGEWVKNSFVVEYQDNGYPTRICLEVQGEDKWNKMKNAAVVGHDVLVKFGVSSREWQGRWFTSCSCYYCSTVGDTHQQQAQQQQYNQNDDLPY